MICEVEDEEERPEQDEGEETNKTKEHRDVQLVLVVDLPPEQDDVGGVADSTGQGPQRAQRHTVLQLEVRVAHEDHAGHGEDDRDQLGEADPVERRGGEDGREDESEETGTGGQNVDNPRLSVCQGRLVGVVPEEPED